MDPVTIVLLVGGAVIARQHARHKRGWEQDRRDNEELSAHVDAMSGEINRRYGGKK